MNLNLSSDNACAKAPASRCSLLASSIPKGLCNSAQGCEERATLGKATDDSQPQRGCGLVLFPFSLATTLSGLSPMWRAFSQGSSSLATLGFVAESLWDSGLATMLVFTLLLSAAPLASAQDRDDPAAELASFQVAAGFQVNLFASEK